MIAARLRSKEHQQFRPVPGVEAELVALTERQQATGSGGSQSMRISASARIRSQAGPNNGWPRSTVRIATPSTWPIARARILRVDHLDAVAVGAEALVADDQRQRDGIDAEDQRPFLGDDMEQLLDAVRIDRSEHRGMNRGNRARMAAGKGNQILVRFLGRAKPRAQVRDGPLLELDHLAHRARMRGERLKILLTAGAEHGQSPLK